MPWGMITEPCLGLSILKAQLEAQGVSARVLHANLWLLKWMQFSTYEKLADVWALNDFIFTGMLDGELDDEQLEALTSIAGEMRESEPEWTESFANRARLLDFILRIRNQAIPAYIDYCAQRVLQGKPELVGLSCLFDQTLPSIVLAKRLKELQPDVKVVLGGYALEGETGHHLLATFPWIDAIHQGDGENSIVALARAASKNKGWYAVPGLLRRDMPCAPREKICMDASPVPDFSDYFKTLDELAHDHKIHVRNLVVPIETSRGCWWGQKSHCVFCGIDDDTMKYRQRSPDNALAVLETLRQRHGNLVFRLVDYILPHSYRKDLLPRLAALPQRFRLTCEMKANASAEQIELIRAAGFEEVQPGIESFDTEVLRGMAKGVTAMQNIVLLKSARRVGLKVHYNLLYGFPADEPEQYQRQALLLPALAHLDAPNSHINVLTTRFAPLQTDPEKFGLPKGRRPHYRYRALFSSSYLMQSGFEADKYCYYFDNAYRNTPELYRWYRILDYQAQAWIERHAGDIPQLKLAPQNYEVYDSRLTSKGKTLTLNELQVKILLHADRDPQMLDALAETLGYSQGVIEEALAVLRGNRLIYEEGRRYFALTVVAYAPGNGEQHSVDEISLMTN